MAGFDAKQRELTLRLVLCGPQQAGKSATLERLRERLGHRGVSSSRSLASLPIVIFGEPTARLLIEIREIDPTDADSDLATCAIAAADGVIFLADSRRERLRDDLVAYAWFLERMREAGRSELPGVLLLNRRDASTRLSNADLEAVLGASRFPSYETDATHGEEIARGVGDLLRRAATRIHGELMLGDSGITLPNLLGAVDVAVTRESLPTPPVEPKPEPVPSLVVQPTVAPKRRPAGAPPRSPLLRFGRRMLSEQARASRDRRRMRDHLAWVDEEARRPLAYLKSLFIHLEREAPRLSAKLDEAVGGGADVLRHLDAVLSGTRKITETSREKAEARSRPCDATMLARQAFASLERELPGAKLSLKRESLPWVDGDPDALRTLFWAAFSAVARSSPPRKGRRTIVRLRVHSDGHGMRIKIGRLGALARGAGLEELILARRLARRLGLSFVLVKRRAGRRDVRLELGTVPMVRVRGPEMHAALS